MARLHLSLSYFIMFFFHEMKSKKVKYTQHTLIFRSVSKIHYHTIQIDCILAINHIHALRAAKASAQKPNSISTIVLHTVDSIQIQQTPQLWYLVRNNNRWWAWFNQNSENKANYETHFTIAPNLILCLFLSISLYFSSTVHAQTKQNNNTHQNPKQTHII